MGTKFFTCSKKINFNFGKYVATEMLFWIRDGQKSGSGVREKHPGSARPQDWKNIKKRVLIGKKFINRKSTNSQVSMRVEIYAGVTPTAGGRARISCSNSSYRSWK
jgi:hypothetical protein